MHNVIDGIALRKQQHRRCLMWHRKVIADTVLTRAAICFAGLIMDDYDMGNYGYTSLSYRKAAKELGIDKNTARGGRDLLVCRGWLIRLPAEPGSRKRAQYKLGDGPDYLYSSSTQCPPSIARSYSLDCGCADAPSSGCTDAPSSGCADAPSHDDERVA